MCSSEGDFNAQVITNDGDTCKRLTFIVQTKW